MISFLGAGACRGCGVLLNVWWDGVHVTLRERSMVASPVHLCTDPEKREHIELETLKDMVAFYCWQCGETDVAPTSWGRVVNFPSTDPSAEGWAEAWVGPLQEHVCQPANTQTQSKQPLAEAYRVWTDGAR